MSPKSMELAASPSTSLSRIIIPLLEQVRPVDARYSILIHFLILSPPQFGDGQDEGGRGVTTIQGLIQAFKIAERSSPGFCDQFVQRTISSLKR